MDKVIAKQRIEELVEQFKQNKSLFHNSNEKETQVRIQFINPFFKALGWNMEDRREVDMCQAQ